MSKKKYNENFNNDEISHKSNVPLWENIFKKNKAAENINLLEQIPLFATLSKKEIRNVALLVYERNYLTNEYLFKEENPGAGMFIIKSGAITIESKSESGEILTLATLTEGDFVGDLALLNDSPRSASARCIKNTTVFVIFRQDLFNLIEKEEKLGLKILKELAIMIGERLKETNQSLLNAKLTIAKYKKIVDEKK